MIREDLSNNLVHLVKGDTAEAALATFDSILAEQSLRGGTGNIKGGWRCVCFTETPLAHLAYSLRLRDAHGIRYYPAGVMVTKQWLFSKGGRPVIYQPDTDYDLLPEDLKYRHVRYELADARADRNVDWTWEREWRIMTEKLNFTPADVTLICPDRAWVDDLATRHFKRFRNMQGASVFMGGGMVQGLISHKEIEKIGRFPWHCVALEDLGVPMDG